MSSGRTRVQKWQRALVYVLPIIMCALLILFGQREISASVPEDVPVREGGAMFSSVALLNYLRLHGLSLEEGLLYYQGDIPAGKLSYEEQEGVLVSILYENTVIFDPEIARGTRLYRGLVLMGQRDRKIATLFCRSVTEALAASVRLSDKAPALLEEKLLACMDTGKSYTHRAGGMLFCFSMEHAEGVGQLCITLSPY